MQEALRLTFIVALLNLSLIAYFITLRTLFPRRSARTRTAADLMPGRSFAVGLVNFLFFGAVALVIFALAGNIGNEALRTVITLPALICLALLGLGFSFGLAGMAELVGERLAPAQSAFRRTLWGTLALSLGASLPLVGWFLLLPYTALVGLGAFIVGFFWKEPAVQA